MAVFLADDEDVRPLLAFIDEFALQDASSPSSDSVESPSDREASSFDDLPGSSASEASTPRATGQDSEDPRHQRQEKRQLGRRGALSGVDVTQANKNAPSTTDKKKKKLNPANSSTEVQRRKRAEIKALREEVMALQAHVVFLKRSRYGSAPANDPAPAAALVVKLKADAVRSLWQDRALFHSRERQRAEHTNRKLKSILASQQKLNETFRALVSKRSILQDMDAVLGGEPVHRSPASVDYSTTVIERLEQQVEALYIGMERREQQSLPSVASCTTESLRDQSRGQIVQVVTTTPMGCSMEESARILWYHITLQREYPDKSYRFLRRINDEAIEKNFVMLMRDSTSNFQLNGLQFMRKYVEPDRIVFVRTNLLLLATSGLRFQDRTCITISRVKDASVVESRYQVHAETEDALDASPSDLSFTQQLLMQRLSSNWRSFEQYLQSVLITEDLRRHSLHVTF